MKWVPVAILLMAAWTVTGQAPAASSVLEDPAGDVAVGFAGQVQSPASGTGAAVDLVSLAIEETPLELVFLIGVAGHGDTQESVRSDDHYIVWFEHHGKAFRAEASRQAGAVGAGVSGWLMSYDEGQQHYQFASRLQASFDEAEGTVQIHAPRDLLADHDGAPPALGRWLEDLYVTSAHMGLHPGSRGILGVDVAMPYWSDRMPDGTEVGVYAVQMGLEQSGHARLFAEQPFRASNGEASTFVFEVQAANFADDRDSFSLEASDVPAGWDVRLPARSLELDAGAEQPIPVVLRTPFAHEHGTSRTFVVELRSDTDPGSVGRVELGIRYPAIAQPAGHHNTLYLHSFMLDESVGGLAWGTLMEAVWGRDGRYVAFMNTHPDVENDQALDVEGDACNTSIGDGSVITTFYCWWVPLLPGLEMGLDFDVEGEGVISVPVTSAVPASRGILSGSLLHFGPPQPGGGPRNVTVVADLVPSEPMDLSSSQSVLTSAIQPTLDGDYVAYEAGSALVLQLVVQADRPGQVLAGPDQGLVLKPGGTLELPLTEYEDRVRSQAAFAAGVRLTHDGPAERLMNPGATAIFNLTAASANEVDDPYLVEVLGANQEWAKLLTPQTIRLGAGDEKTLGVAVVAPGAAADGERADLIVQVTSANDPNLRALARLLATVDVDAEHPDDALHAVELDPKNVPVVPIAVVLVGLAAAAGQRRTRMRP